MLRVSKDERAIYDKLIALEPAYLNGELPNFLDHINATGINVDDYCMLKRRIALSARKFVIEDITLNEYYNKLAKLKAEGKEAWYNVRCEKYCTFVGAEDYDKDYCIANSVDIMPLNFKGGTIVTTDADFCLAIPVKLPNIMPLILNSLVYSLNINGVNCELAGNDILVDGYKVVGSAETTDGDYTIYYLQISMRVNIDMIRAICKKTMEKVPKGIIDMYPNVTRDGIIKGVNAWLLS